MQPQPRPMRLHKREVTDAAQLAAIIDHADVVRVGAVDAEGIFIVPMSFGYETSGSPEAPTWTFWLHCAGEGRKVDAWRANPQVALELDVAAEVICGTYACAYSQAYESVMASGTISQVGAVDEKTHGLERIMAHMAPGAPVTFSPEAVERVSVWKVEVTRLTGKRREPKG